MIIWQTEPVDVVVTDMAHICNSQLLLPMLWPPLRLQLQKLNGSNQSEGLHFWETSNGSEQ